MFFSKVWFVETYFPFRRLRTVSLLRGFKAYVIYILPKSIKLSLSGNGLGVTSGCKERHFTHWIPA